MSGKGTSEPLELADRVAGMVGPGAEAVATVTAESSGLTRFANSFIHQHVGETVTAVRLTVAVDGRVASSSTTRTDEEALSRLAEATLEAARVRPVDPDWAGLAPPAPAPEAPHDDPATHDPDPAARAAQVRAFVDAGPGFSAAGYVDSSGYATALANSAGQRVAGRASRATVDGIHQSATSAGKGHQTALRLADLDGGRAGAEAARLARRGAGPTDAEPGRYEVVLAPECVATICAFLAAYGFNAKMAQEGQSFAAVGEAQFDPAISLWDDVTDPRALGLAFDAEGTPKRRVDLVAAGTTAGLAHDRRTAKKAGTESTGHAVPGGESFGAFPSNLFLGTGQAGFDEMVSAMPRGLLVTEFNYCRILDPKTQVVTGLTRNGTFLVEGGEVTRAVKNLRFTQSFVDALAPGKVLGVESSSRFADAEFGVGLAHVPALRLAEWAFTGGARG